MFRKVTIIGVGLIGGSIGMAIKQKKLAREVVGVGRRHGPLVMALKNQAIDKAGHDIQKAVNGADVVILATPVETIIKMISEIGRFLKRGCIVTDAGSTKQNIVEAAEKHLPGHVHFIGSHPLSGSEKKGNVYASADLFRDSLCILTPTGKTNKFAKDKMKSFWIQLGAVVKFLSPEDHDLILSYVSHVPHVLAYGLAGVVPAAYLEYASRGFKDTTRVAASDPELWSDICLANSKNIIKALDGTVDKLGSIRKAMSSHRKQDLVEIFKESKKRRDGIS